jgi:outer membrane protein assembly factor BamB
MKRSCLFSCVTLALVCLLVGSALATPGATLWIRRDNGSANSDDVASSVAVSPDASIVFVTGSSEGSAGGADYATTAYDASTGARRWLQRYNGPANGSDFATSLAVSPDGSTVFVTGYSAGPLTSFDYATIAYDATTGTPVWTKRYVGPVLEFGGDFPQSIAVSPDGTAVLVTGYSEGRSTSVDYATVAYDAATGGTLWTKRYDGPGSGPDYASSVAVSPDGATVFVTGDSYSSTTGADYTTIAYAAVTGTTVWTKRSNPIGTPNSDDIASSVGVSPDGSTVFVTGYSEGSAAPFDYLTIAYRAGTGTTKWKKRYSGPGNGDDYAYALAVSPTGTEVIVTGYSTGSTTGADYTTVAYAAVNGTTVWTRRYNGPGNGDDYAQSVAVSADGAAAFVTGFSFGATTGFDYATIAYDATAGAPLWGRRYDGPASGDDFASSVAVSPKGTALFITGRSYGSGTSLDYATIALSAS